MRAFRDRSHSRAARDQPARINRTIAHHGKTNEIQHRGFTQLAVGLNFEPLIFSLT